MVGGEVLDGGTGFDVTIAVGADNAVAEPAEFEAVTAATNVAPPSAETTWYADPVAPTMSAQFPPLESQRRHWYEYVSGCVPVQVPVVVVRVCPSCVVPLTAGADVFAGGAAATTPVAADVAADEPAEFVAVTRTTTVEPTSADVNV